MFTTAPLSTQKYCLLLLLSSALWSTAYAEMRPVAEHHLRLYGEFVYMRRGNIHDKTLVKNSDKHQNPCKCPNFEVLDTADLVNRMGFEPGFRVGAIYTENVERSYEANFLYLQSWHAQKEKEGHQTLSFPFTHTGYTHDYHNASAAKAEYSMHFWDTELNFWRHFTPRYVDYFSLSGIAGLRYFHWNEHFELTMHRPPDKSDYAIRTKNNVFGVQLGLNLQINPTEWLSWELMAKVGGVANHAKQKTFLGDEDNTVRLRHFERQKWQISGFVDLSALIAFQFKDRLNLHAGYEMLFLSGLALAPEQISKKTGSDAGKRVYVDGDGMIHGLFAGVMWSF